MIVLEHRLDFTVKAYSPPLSWKMPMNKVIVSALPDCLQNLDRTASRDKKVVSKAEDALVKN